MKRDRDIDYFMELNYASIMRIVKGQCYVFVPELSIIAKGKSPNEAYEAMEQQKREYFTRVVVLGVQESVEEPRPIAARRRINADFGVFSIKCLILSIIFAGILLISVFSLDKLVVDRMGEFRSSINAWISEDLPNATISAVTARLRELSDESNEQQRDELKRSIRQLKPYIDELKVMFEEDDNPESTKLPTDD